MIKSRKRTPINRESFQNGIFTVFWITLLLLIPLSLLIPSLDSVFQPFLGQTLYSWLIMLITLETMLWGAFKLKTKLGSTKRTRPFTEVCVDIFKLISSFVGFKRGYYRNEIVAGVFVGVLLAVSTIISRSYFESLPIHFTNPLVVLYLLLTRFEMWSVLLLVPIFEEIIHRALFINRLVGIIKHRLIASVFAMISTAFVFGWSHLESPIYKMLAGLALAVVYMWKWRKNILTTTIAHMSANLLFFFLTLQ